uniref:Uncharacterized protein n=1 Tax=Caenorhabditis japonica TaxID=281687 RepID=A0A8R1ET15_CAEJA
MGPAASASTENALATTLVKAANRGVGRKNSTQRVHRSGHFGDLEDGRGSKMSNHSLAIEAGAIKIEGSAILIWEWYRQGWL